jgi:DME family drug/metabolite transporter
MAGQSGEVYLLLATTAVLHTAGAYTLYTAGLRRLEVGQASIASTVELVAATALGALLLSEELTVLKALGAALVLAGAVLAQLRRARREGS